MMMIRRNSLIFDDGDDIYLMMKTSGCWPDDDYHFCDDEVVGNS